MKLLTVAVPTFNTEKYLERCLQSLVYDDKALESLEIIVVNDGSTDNSLAIAREYEKKYPNTIVIIDKPNGGHGSAINKALGIAKGKYFRVVDSDDWVNIIDFPDHFKDLKKYDVDIVLTNYNRELVYEGASEEFKYGEVIPYGRVFNLSDFDLKLFKDNYFFLATSDFRTEFLRKAGVKLDEKTYYVDMEFVIFPIKEMSTFVYLNYNIYRYYQGRNDQSISAQSMVRNRIDHEKVLRKLLHFYKMTKLSKNKKKYVAKILILMLNSHYMIYCGQKTQEKSMTNEIRAFDLFLNREYGALYDKVAVKFPYIAIYRSSKFMFIHNFYAIYKKYVDHVIFAKGKGEKYS